MLTQNDQHFFGRKEEGEEGDGIKREFYENGALLDDYPQRYSFSPVLLLPEASFVIYYLLA